MGPNLSGRWCYHYIAPATLGALNVPLSEHSLHAYLAVEDDTFLPFSLVFSSYPNIRTINVHLEQ